MVVGFCVVGIGLVLVMGLRRLSMGMAKRSCSRFLEKCRRCCWWRCCCFWILLVVWIRSGSIGSGGRISSLLGRPIGVRAVFAVVGVGGCLGKDCAHVSRLNHLHDGV